MDQDHQNQLSVLKCILHINFKNMKTQMFFCRTASIFINKWASAYSTSFPSCPQLWDGFILFYFYSFVVWHRLVVQRSESQRGTGSTYEDMPITGLEKAEERERTREVPRQPLQPAFEKRIHFCHTHFPSAGSAGLSRERGDTHRQHTGGYTHTRHLLKVAGLKRAYSHTVKWRKIRTLIPWICSWVCCFYT